MAIKRATIIADIKSGLESITTANGFTSDVVEVRRGFHWADEFNDQPALSLFNHRAPSVDMAVGLSETTLHCVVHGFCKAIEADYTVLDGLLEDVVKALMTEAYNPHVHSTKIGEAQIDEGGVAPGQGIIEVQFTVEYERELDAI